MKNKYYTPSIEEFHFGFECEVYITVQRYGSIKRNEDTETDNADNAFYPMIFGNKNSKCELLVLGELIHTQKLNVDKFRVKYLDKEDIESLGFSYYKTHPGMEQMEFDKGEYELTYNPNFKGKQWLRINLEGEGDVTLFSGSIKNKSELKVLLKQLNIK